MQKEAHQKILKDFMSYLSEKCHGCSWKPGIEQDLWNIMMSGKEEEKWGGACVTFAEIVALSMLYQDAQGWPLADGSWEDWKAEPPLFSVVLEEGDNAHIQPARGVMGHLSEMEKLLATVRKHVEEAKEKVGI